jgi:hypothetical protein
MAGVLQGQVMSRSLMAPILLMFCLSACVGAPSQQDNPAPTQELRAEQDWMEDFNLPARKLSSIGKSRYFILEPGFQLILASGNTKLTITVLNETKEVNGTTTRVIEEREESNRSLSEISRNFYAIDQETGDVFYYGEDVDFYTNGQITGHGGGWLAYERENRPGLIMPGVPKVGMKYYQELAPGVAADRARVVSDSETITTLAGNFKNCLLTQESSSLEPAVVEYKTYCPGIGLVRDESLTLVSYQTAGKTKP